MIALPGEVTRGFFLQHYLLNIKIENICNSVKNV